LLITSIGNQAKGNIAKKDGQSVNLIGIKIRIEIK
jgi:hypothetical protein